MRTFRRLQTVMKMLRLGAFLMFVQFLVSALLVRHVSAQIQGLMLSVGSQMMRVAELSPAAQPRTVRLNGAQVRLRVQTAPNQKLKDVLDVFHQRCRERNGRFYEQLSAQELQRKLPPPPRIASLDGVLRTEGGSAGAIACLDLGESKETPASILARAERFLETGDAHEFGELRYVRAEQVGDDVFAVMLWTDGPFKVSEMFPAEGDAPGLDFQDLPRPPGSRRLLSAWEEGEAPALDMYTVKGKNAASLEAYYRSELGKLGWQLTTSEAGTAAHHARGMMAMRDGVTVVVAMDTDAYGNGVASIVPSSAGAIDVR